jgi:hypothetical protein
MRDSLIQATEQALALGYDVIFAQGKDGPGAGWPDRPLPKSWKRANMPTLIVRLHTTVMLAALDVDVSDPAMVDRIMVRLFERFPALVKVPCRGNTKNAKMCFFFRTDVRWGRLATKHYKPADDSQPGQMVEAYGGGFAKYFSIFGTHDLKAKPEPTDYTVEGDSPALWEIHPDELPVFTEAQVNEMLLIAEQTMKAEGWVTREALDPNIAPGTTLYDLTEDMQFISPQIDYAMTLDELRQEAPGIGEDGLPVYMGFLPGRGEDWNPNRASARVDHLGLCITEWPDTKHRPVDAKPEPAQDALPASLAPSSFFTAAKERQAAERGHDPHDWTDAGIQARFAFCPTKGSGMVYEIAKHGQGGMSVTACRLDWQEHAVWDADEEKFINPFGAWIGGEKRRVEGIEMRPDHKTDIFDDGFGPMLNSYYPPSHPDDGGDTRAFHAYFEHMIPDPIERAWFWGQLCHKVQHPEVPGPGTVLVARIFGSGRGTLFSIIGKLIGERFMHQVDFGMITGRNAGARFNGWQAENLIVTIEEAKDDVEGDTLRGRASAFEVIKSKIEPSADRLVTVEKKGQDQISGRAFATFLIATNHADAIKLPEGDRRIAVITCGPRLPEVNAHRIRAWMSDPLNIGALYREMMAEDLTASTFEPYNSPPLFAGKQTMIEAGRSGLEQAFEDALAEIPSQLVTQASVVAHMERMDFDRPNNWGSVVKTWVRANLHPVGGTMDRVYFTGAGKQRVFARSSELAVSWSSVGVKELHREVAKGYAASALPIANDVPIFKKAKSQKNQEK